MLSIFSCVSWPFVCLFRRNVYLGLLPIKKIFFRFWTAWAALIFWRLYLGLLPIKSNKIFSFVETWMDLVSPEWSKSEREKQISYINAYMWNLERCLLKLMSNVSVVPFNHLILCCPLLTPISIFSSIRVFSSESVLHIKWPKYWSFSFSISPSNEYSGLISFGMDLLDLLAV